MYRLPMASALRAAPVGLGAQLAGRRACAASRPLSALTVHRPRRAMRAGAGAGQLALRLQMRLASTDTAAPAADAPKPKPKPKKAGFFRKAWRLTYLSVLAGVGYLCYGVWEARNPGEQMQPDPSKKTLVVLGASGGRVAHRWLTANQARDGAPCRC